jgi:hypothetical protein
MIRLVASALLALVCACGDGSGGDDAGAPQGGTDGGDSNQRTDGGAERDSGQEQDAAVGPTCIQPGDDCTTGDCCSSATCIVTTASTFPVCAADCLSHAQCSSGCCSPLEGGGSVCSPPAFCEPACVDVAQECSADSCCDGSSCVANCGGMETCAADCSSDFDCDSGCCDSGVCQPPWICGGADCRGASCLGCTSLILIGDDSEFLGNLRASTVATDGVCNTVSPFGSTVGSNSIFNSVGIYGSSVSPKSAYSTITQTPPIIFCEDTGDIVGFVTKNTLINGGTDPDALCATLDANACN